MHDLGSWGGVSGSSGFRVRARVYTLVRCGFRVRTRVGTAVRCGFRVRTRVGITVRCGLGLGVAYFALFTTISKRANISHLN